MDLPEKDSTGCDFVGNEYWCLVVTGLRRNWHYCVLRTLWSALLHCQSVSTLTSIVNVKPAKASACEFFSRLHTKRISKHLSKFFFRTGLELDRCLLGKLTFDQKYETQLGTVWWATAAIALLWYKRYFWSLYESAVLRSIVCPECVTFFCLN